MFITFHAKQSYEHDVIIKTVLLYAEYLLELCLIECVAYSFQWYSETITAQCTVTAMFKYKSISLKT